MDIRAREAAEAVGGVLILGDGDTRLRHISLSSGKMQGKDLFVPIIGERVDAHRFLKDAFSHGAVCAFTSEHPDRESAMKDPELAALCSTGKEPCLIAVEDTRAALQRLGRWYRKERVHIPLVGVTGSVGKTTTREMIACALSAEKKVYATKGNSNSQVGVPITMTETDEDAQIGVIELGMSEFGEMSRISQVACVDVAVITNIGVSHINQLKTQENIMKEKLHILDGMPEGAWLILNGDDPLLRELTEEKIHAYGIAEGRSIRLLFYGTSEKVDIRVLEVRTEKGCPRFQLQLPEGQRISCSLKTPGMHMVLNGAAAVAAAAVCGVSPEGAARALSSFEGVGGRGRTFEKGGITFIDDSYNAAPASMKAGLSVLSETPAEGRRIAVLADMLELGDREKDYHREVGAYIRQQGLALSQLWLYGPLARCIAEGYETAAGEKAGESAPRIRLFDRKEELLPALSAFVKTGDAVLFKGSNSMGLSTVLADLLKTMDEETGD